jgi:hypothetical protein
MRQLVAGIGVAAMLLAAGCNSSDKGLSAEPQASASPSAAPAAVNARPTCAPAPAKPYAWPKPVPADLPRLPGGILGETKQTKDGLTIVRFRTQTSLRDGVLFILKNLPPAGYVLGRGDAEQTEADAPFNKGPLRGVLRGISTELCKTEWLLAVTDKQLGAGTGSPLLPARPGVSPSPLPFGNG